MSGLALGIGMLVDNSIVVIENIYRLRKEGKTIVIIDHTDDVGNYFSKTIMLENDNGILRG